MSEASFHETVMAAARADVAAARARREKDAEEHHAVLSRKGDYLCGFRFRYGDSCSGSIGTPLPGGRIALTAGLGVQLDGTVGRSRHWQRNVRMRAKHGPIKVELPIVASCPVCGRRYRLQVPDRSRTKALADAAWERFHEAIGRADGNEDTDPDVARAWGLFQEAESALGWLKQEGDRNG